MRRSVDDRCADGVRGLGNLRHPERDALAGGDIGLLGRAEIGERVGDLTRAKVEGAAVGAQAGELLFGTDDEEGSGAERDQREGAAGKSHSS